MSPFFNDMEIVEAVSSMPSSAGRKPNAWRSCKLRRPVDEDSACFMRYPRQLTYVIFRELGLGTGPMSGTMPVGSE